MKTLNRHVFSLFFFILFLAILIAWWRSSRAWTAYYVESPMGYLTLYSESSLAAFELTVTHHENRWSARRETSEITGDYMQWVRQWPEWRRSGHQWNGIIPYWQVDLTLLILAILAFFREKIRAKRRLETSRTAPSESRPT